MDQFPATPAISPATTAISPTAGRITSSAIRELLAVADRPGVISLAGGLPSPHLFPRQETAQIIDGLVRGDPGVLQYSSTEGEPGLREWVAARHHSRPGQVLITHGAQQALDLVARVTLAADDPVALADPGYIGAIQAMRLNGGRLVALPTDSEGLGVEVLDDQLGAGLRPRLVYVVPNFHNPTGATLSIGRARRLAQLADHYGFLVVEDDPYGDIRFAGTAPPALSTLTDRVASIGTISKVLFPGLRVGWIVAPPWLAPSLALVKQAMDLHTATLAQRVALDLLTRPGFLTRHVAVLRSHYAGQARILAEALATELGDRLEVTAPQGGMFLWARARGVDVDTHALLATAIDRGVAYVPGSAFSVVTPQRASLRLSYATAAPEELVEGARRLAGVLLDRSGPRPDPTTARTAATI